MRDMGFHVVRFFLLTKDFLLDVSVDEYYTAPDAHFTRPYARWLERGF
jgi:hypothetical protein